MECSCEVGVCIDEEGLETLKARSVVARQGQKCCECGRILSVGEEYLFESLVKISSDDEWDIPREMYNFITCMDCESIRDQFFTDFFYTQILDDLDDHIQAAGSVNEDCISKLTPRAREIVCKMIEDVWENTEA